MTLERILLQTIKFDLMVEHPYAYLLKFAKLIKGNLSKTTCLHYTDVLDIVIKNFLLVNLVFLLTHDLLSCLCCL